MTRKMVEQDDANQDKVETPGTSLAVQVDALIEGGYLPRPDIRLAVGDIPVWSFPAICSLFDLSANQLIDAILESGPAHLPDDRGIPSSWELVRTMHL